MCSENSRSVRPTSANSWSAVAAGHHRSNVMSATISFATATVSSIGIRSLVVLAATVFVIAGILELVSRKNHLRIPAMEIQLFQHSSTARPRAQQDSSSRPSHSTQNRQSQGSPIFKPYATGVMWAKVASRTFDRDARIELRSVNLTTALTDKIERLPKGKGMPKIELTQWNDLGLPRDLHSHHYVAVRNELYQPLTAYDRSPNATFISNFLREASRMLPPAPPAAMWLRANGGCATAVSRSALSSLHAIDVCHNDTHGLVVATFEDVDERSLMLRVSGPTVQTLLFARAPTVPTSSATTTKSWVAAFRLCLDGSYSFHVRLLFHMTGDDPVCASHHKPESLLLDGFELKHAQASSAASNAKECLHDQWHGPGASKVPAIDLRQPAGNFHKPLGGLVHGDGAVASPSQWWFRSKDNTALPVCFIGDNTVREIVNQLISKIKYPGVATCDPFAAQLQRRACNASGIVYMSVTYGREAADKVKCLVRDHVSLKREGKCAAKVFMPQEASQCRTVLVNFGQWAASHTHREVAPPGSSGPMSLDSYETMWPASSSSLLCFTATALKSGG